MPPFDADGPEAAAKSWAPVDPGPTRWTRIPSLYSESTISTGAETSVMTVSIRSVRQNVAAATRPHLV